MIYFRTGLLQSPEIPTLALLLAVALPGLGATEWPLTRGDAARTNHYSGPNPAAPPLAELGDYGFRGVAAPFASLAISPDRMFYVTETGITAIERNPERDATEPYILDGEAWVHGQSFNFVPNQLTTMKGEFVLHQGQVVFTEQTILNPGVSQEFTTSVVALDQETGAETWRHVLPETTTGGMTMVEDTVFVRHLPISEGISPLPTRLARIPFGATTSTHTVSLGFVSSSTDPIASPEAGLVYSEEERNIAAFRASDLGRAWTFLVAQDEGTVGIRDMIAVGSDVVAMLTDDTLLSIDSEGGENWRVPIPKTDGDCNSSLGVLATDGKVIVVAGHCSDVLFGFRASDGEAIWNVGTPFFNRQAVPLIGGGVIHYPVVLDVLTAQPGLMVYDLETGALMQTLETAGNSPHFALAAGDGRIFGVGDGIQPLARIITYRSTAEPAPDPAPEVWAIH